jgi:serum/glucocorticoid-regulated kinase 2
MKYYKGGTLRNLMNRVKAMSESQARFYAAELILAIRHLHENLDTVYRDLKPSNVALTDDGHIELIDFGLCKQNINFFEKAHTFCGSSAYLSPEMITGEGHGKAIDWYGIGVLFYELVTGMPPFFDQSPEKMMQNIKNGHLDLSIKFSDEGKDFLLKVSCS